MGMGNLASHVIMFIAVLSVSTMVVAIFHDQVDSTSSSIVTQQNWLSQQLKTDISIEVIDFRDISENQTMVYLENTGGTRLDLEYVDVYLGGERISREQRTVEVIADTEIANTGIWDPKEGALITINKTLVVNTTYELIVTTQYGGRSGDEFST